MRGEQSPGAVNVEMLMHFSVQGSEFLHIYSLCTDSWELTSFTGGCALFFGPITCINSEESQFPAFLSFVTVRLPPLPGVNGGVCCGFVGPSVLVRPPGTVIRADSTGGVWGELLSESWED